MLFVVVAEFELNGTKITQTFENVDATSIQDASDSAYENVLRNEPSAKSIEILSVTKAVIGV